MDEDIYTNIRDILGQLIGKTVVDITQHDRDEFEENGTTFVQLHFEEGLYVKFMISEGGFYHNCEEKLYG